MRVERKGFELLDVTIEGEKMRVITRKNLALALIFMLVLGVVTGIDKGNALNGLLFGLWAFVVFYLIPMLVVELIKPKSEGVELVMVYLTMAFSGFLLARPFGVSLREIRPMLYGAVLGALFGVLFHLGGFEKLEKFVDEKLQPDIKVKRD